MDIRSTPLISKLKNTIPLHPYYSAISLYTALDALVFGLHQLFLGMNDYCLGYAGNFSFFSWSLAWWKYCLISGINPFYSNYIWSPTGVSLAWNALLSPTYGILSIPFQYIANPATIANIILLAQPLLSSFAAFALCYKLTKSTSGSIFGGYIFGFSTYMLAEASESLPNNMTTFIIPFMALLCYMFYVNEISKLKFYVLTSLLLIAQAGVFLEILLSGSIVTAITLVAFYAFNIGGCRPKILTMAAILFGSYLTTAVIISPMLYEMLVNNYYGGTKFGWNGVSVVSLVVPVGVNIFYNPNLLEKTWSMGPAFVSGYISIPLAAFVIYFIFSRRFKQYNILKLLFLIFLLISLGRALHFVPEDWRSGTILLPWSLTKHIPILKDVQPHRFFIYCDLLLSIMFAYYTKQIKWKYLYVFYAVVFIALLPNIGGLQNNIYIPKFIYNKQYTKYIEQGSNVLFVSSDGYSDGMLYQAISNFYFRIPQGITQGPGTTPPNYQLGNAIQIWQKNSYAATLHRYIDIHGVEYIVITGHSDILIRKIEPLCLSIRRVDGVVVCRTKYSKRDLYAVL